MSSTSSRPALRAVVVIATALVTLVGGLLMATPAQAQKIYPSYFGIHGSGAIGKMSLGSIRLWDVRDHSADGKTIVGGVAWRDMERPDGQYNWTALDREIEAAGRGGLRPLIVLGQTPTRHIKRGAKASPKAAYGSGAASMPDLWAWKTYVTKVTSHVTAKYGNAADYQVWNEPNIVNYWVGTPTQMADLTKVAYSVIRDVAPGAKVVAPSFPLRLNEQRTWYRAYWKTRPGGKSIASYVNVVSVNLYPLANQGPESMLPLIRFAKAALPKVARSKQMWNTEINYGLLGGATATRIPSAKQAAYVARTLLLNAASPIRRVYWYSWDVGLIANTQINSGTSLTAAGRAWGRTRGWLWNTNTAACVRTATGKRKGLYTCTARTRSQVRRFYWKPTGSAIRVKTSKTTYSWTSLSGRKTDPRKTRSYTITVGQAPVMVASRR